MSFFPVMRLIECFQMGGSDTVVVKKNFSVST